MIKRTYFISIEWVNAEPKLSSAAIFHHRSWFCRPDDALESQLSAISKATGRYDLKAKVIAFNKC